MRFRDEAEVTRLIEELELAQMMRHTTL
jgi:hypothetical protein